jgi:hypothetical protein
MFICECISSVFAEYPSMLLIPITQPGGPGPRIYFPLGVLLPSPKFKVKVSQYVLVSS